jgi:hypothetical protein
MVFADTTPGLPRALDAVIRETPATRATSCSVADFKGVEEGMGVEGAGSSKVCPIIRLVVKDLLDREK